MAGFAFSDNLCSIYFPPLPDHRPTTHWVYHTTNYITQAHAPDNGQNCCPKHVELIRNLSINRYCCI